jgi:hypothetical protein
VRPSSARVVISLALALYLALPAVAPEHVHEGDADHHHAAVHRHLQPHSLTPDDDHTQLAEDDAHVVWLDTVAVTPSEYRVAMPALATVARFELVPPLIERAAPPDYDTAPPHGPPRTAVSLRAPPISPAFI